jgi:ABC-type oligopeptide transport system substrate-binding subunit
MSRILAALALVAATASLSACAEPVTAPRQPLLVPSMSRDEALDPSICKSGWISTDGRCA